jgi:hypothetical protein
MDFEKRIARLHKEIQDLAGRSVLPAERDPKIRALKARVLILRLAQHGLLMNPVRDALRSARTLAVIFALIAVGRPLVTAARGQHWSIDQLTAFAGKVTIAWLAASLVLCALTMLQYWRERGELNEAERYTDLQSGGGEPLKS